MTNTIVLYFGALHPNGERYFGRYFDKKDIQAKRRDGFQVFAGPIGLPDNDTATLIFNNVFDNYDKQRTEFAAN